MAEIPGATTAEIIRALRRAAPSERVSVHLGAAAHEALRLQRGANYAGSIDVLQRELASNATDAEAWWLLSVALLAHDRPADALETADYGVSLRPRAEWGHRLRSISLLRLGPRRAGREAATEATRLDPNEPMAFVALSAAALADGKAKEAMAAAERAIALAPRLPDAYLAYAEVALQQKRWREAEGAARAAIGILPEDPVARTVLGAALLGQRRRSEALAEYARAAAAEPPGSSTRSELARAWAAPLAGGLTIVAYITFIGMRGALRDFSEITVLGVLVVMLVSVLAVGMWGMFRRHRDAAALSPSARAIIAEEEHRRGWRRLVPMLTLTGFVVAVVIGLILVARPKASLVLEVGDCFSVRRQISIEQVLDVACEVPHDFELYAIFEYPGSRNAPYPGLDALHAFARRQCEGAYEDYLGIPFEQGVELWIKPLVPEPVYWEAGTRRIMCAVGDPDGDQLVGSVRVADRPPPGAGVRESDEP